MRVALLLLARFPVELFPRKSGSPVEERCPHAERGRPNGVADELADEPFDAPAFEHEDHGLLREKDAVPPKAGQREPVGRTLRENLSGSLARAWQELGNDGETLILVTLIRPRRSQLPTEQPRNGGADEPKRRADPVVEGGRHQEKSYSARSRATSGDADPLLVPLAQPELVGAHRDETRQVRNGDAGVTSFVSGRSATARRQLRRAFDIRE